MKAYDDDKREGRRSQSCRELIGQINNVTIFCPFLFEQQLLSVSERLKTGVLEFVFKNRNFRLNLHSS